MSTPLSNLSGLGRQLRRAGFGLALAGALMASVDVQAQSPQIAAMRAQVQTQETAAASAAAQDLARFVKHQQKNHADGLPKGFPFAIGSMAELASARLGRGFAVYTVDPADVASASELSAVAKPTGTWRFIVRSGSRPVGLATVEQVAGQWQVVSYGGGLLAQEVDAQMRQHGNADHSNLRFIRVFQARSDFLEVDSGNGAARVAPLISARQSLRLPERAGLVDQAEVMPSLRAAVAANLADFQL